MAVVSEKKNESERERTNPNEQRRVDIWHKRIKNNERVFFKKKTRVEKYCFSAGAESLILCRIAHYVNQTPPANKGNKRRQTIEHRTFRYE